MSAGDFEREAYRVALHAFADAHFDCGEWNKAEYNDETYEAVHARADLAGERLAAALAALIASERAELLAACKVGLAVLETLGLHEEMQLRAAIAKAEGGAVCPHGNELGTCTDETCYLADKRRP